MKRFDLFCDLETRLNRIRFRLARSYSHRIRKSRLHYDVDVLYATYNDIICRGWVFCENKKVSSVQLVMVQKGRTWRRDIGHGLLREDVQRYYGIKIARNSGFSGHTFLTDVKGRVKVFLAVEFEEGASENIFSGVVRLEATGGRILRNRELYSAKTRPRNGSIALYASSLGNYFFGEIRDVLEAGFEGLGYTVDLRDENDGFACDVDWHVIIAPHEFFYLGRGIDLQRQDSPVNTVLLNTEQPSTEWFTRAYNMFGCAYAIWDISASSAAELAESCGFASYLPLGYVEDLPLFEAVQTLPVHEGTCFLDPETHAGSHLETPLEQRPIDIFFVGHASERRQEFFAKHAAFFAKYDCYFHLSPLDNPVIPGETTYMDSKTVVGLEQRSKIVLNIHHGKDTYFEWHRIVMHGIWQKALVVTEPCTAAPPFEANVDYVEEELDAIPERIQYFLSSEKGREEARIFTERAFKTLTEECSLTQCLSPVLADLEHRTNSRRT